MSRGFASPFSLDRITFAPGNSPSDQGPITIAMLGRTSGVNFTGWVLTGRDGGGTRIWSALAANNSGSLMYMENDFSSGGPLMPQDKWCWFVWTKASGSVLPRYHLLNITDGSAWVHQDGSSNVPDGSGPITEVHLGSDGSGSTSNGWRGEIVASATWASVLSDVDIEATFTLSATDLAAGNPDWGVLLNQASTSDTVLDFTGNGGDQTGLAGTTIDGDEPPGWSYDLTPSGLTVAVWNGTVELPATVTVWNGSTEDAATVSEVV